MEQLYHQSDPRVSYWFLRLCPHNAFGYFKDPDPEQRNQILPHFKRNYRDLQALRNIWAIFRSALENA